MQEDSNLHIVKRLAELAKNPLDYSVYPKPFRQEHIFLANWLNDALRQEEREFAEKFQRAVGKYKSTLSEGKGYGWFHNDENLCWSFMTIQQLKYVIYGEKFTLRQIKFNKALGNLAYKDLIEQIDRTALMTDEELKAHNEECNRIAEEVMMEILAEEKRATQ